MCKLYHVVNKQHHVYGLCDPETGELVYIGCTDDFSQRMRHHSCVYEKRRSKEKLSIYLKDLMSKGMSPVPKIFGIYHDYYTGRAREKQLIKDFKPRCNTKNL